MRVFIAVEVSQEIIRRLTSVQEELPAGMKLVKPENMHITLKFLGEVNKGEANEISNIMDSVEFRQIPLICRGLGAFPSKSFVRVLWAGIESPGLIELHSKLEQKLVPLGFEKEEFIQHLTIARAREKIRLEQILKKHADELFGRCTIDSICLKKSTLTPEGPVYEDLHISSVKN